MQRVSHWRWLVPCALIAVAGVAEAKKPFGVAAEVNSTPVPETSFSSVDDTVDYLEALFPDAGTQQIDAGIDFRGLTSDQGLSSGLSGSFGLQFAANDDLLFFEVPALNLQMTFGGTGVCATGGPAACAEGRRAALRELRDFLRKDPSFLKALLSVMPRYSPIDPLAGNPDSLFSRSMRRDFQYGFMNKVSQIWGCGTSAFNFTNDAPIQVAVLGGASDIFAEAQARAAALRAQNEIGFGLATGMTTADAAGGGDYKSTSIEMPLSYTVKFDSDPRKKFRIELPLGYVDTEGAATYMAGLGMAYTHPLTDDWSLTPSIGAGATGSDDLGSAGGVASYSLTSAYTWRLGGFALSMGNAVGRYEALGIKIGEVEAEAELSNTVFTNGFLLSGPGSLIARNLVLEYSFVDTRITGDELYTDTYDEIGVALGYISTDMGVIDSITKVGISYLMATGDFEDINSLRLNLSVRF